MSNQTSKSGVKMSTMLSLRRIPHEINRNLVADKNSHRVSIPKNSVSVSSFFLVMILSLLPNISNGDDKRFEGVKRSTFTRASTAAEVKIGDLYAVVVGVSNYKLSRADAASEGFQSPQMEGRIIGTFPMALAKDYSGPESQIGPPEVRLTKKTGSQAVKARISLIDDQAKMFINGREVLVGNWGRGERGVPIGHQPGDTGIEDIAHFFHRGANEVRFWLWNDAVCCDVSAKFEISVNDNPLIVEKIQRKDSSAGVKFDKTFLVVLDETGTFIVQR